KKFSEIDIQTASDYACEDADVTFRLYSFFNEKIDDDKQKKLYREVERPLVGVIARIENNGVLLDKKNLQSQNKNLKNKSQKIEKDIYKLAGKEFNIGSPKQLQEIFFDTLGIPIIRKTPKGQPSTSEDVLQELSQNYEIAKLVLQFRNLMKLINTYTDRLGQQINNKTGRLHTSYHQAVTITGRLSSSDPNLQNIPIRSDDGKKIRSAFIAEKKCKIVSADYSQIELRVMAHLSKDKNLTKNFLNNEDVHASTAKEIFNIDSKPDDEQRRYAKTINFGLIYGISSFGLAKQLGIDNNSAKQYIETYFQKYSGVRKFMELCKKETKKSGFIRTILGRKIFIPNIKHTNFQIRSAAERTAINAPIQGTAADIIKIAMIDIDTWIQKSKCPVKIIMQVHDELVFEIQENFVDEAVEKINEIMSNPLKLSVPLLVEVGVNENWGDAH
ncbi:MAG: DNA polymerase, partial [Pseudomonadota bacterium]|nr:DNA polymerase [Pseudomonadota bacterium]